MNVPDALTSAMDSVLLLLRENGYADKTIEGYTQCYDRLKDFVETSGVTKYSPEVGESFLAAEEPFVNCNKRVAIRRLNDFCEGRPFRYQNDGRRLEAPPCFAGVLEEFLAYCESRGNKAGTLTNKRIACSQFLAGLVDAGCDNLRDMVAADVTQALLHVSSGKNYGLIRLFLEFLFDRGELSANLSFIVPQYREPQPLPTTYRPDEIDLVERSVDRSTLMGRRDYAIILLASRTGIRAGDIAKLKWDEIDFDRRYLSIVQQKTDVPLKLPIADALLEALKEHKEQDVYGNDGFVFHSMCVPHGPITAFTVYDVVEKHIKRAGVYKEGKKCGPHALRASLATSMVNDGVDYNTVRGVLGQKDPNVIRHYAKVDIEQLRMYALDPPEPTGVFAEFLSGKRVMHLV